MDLSTYDLHLVDTQVALDATPTVEEVLCEAFLSDLGMLYVSGGGDPSPYHRQYVEWLLTFFVHIVKHRGGLILGVVGTPKNRRTRMRGSGQQAVVIEDIPYVSEFDELDAPPVEVVEERLVNQLLGA
jgi:hypothetical protein